MHTPTTILALISIDLDVELIFGDLTLYPLLKNYFLKIPSFITSNFVQPIINYNFELAPMRSGITSPRYSMMGQVISLKVAKLKIYKTLRSIRHPRLLY